VCTHVVRMDASTRCERCAHESSERTQREREREREGEGEGGERERERGRGRGRERGTRLRLTNLRRYTLERPAQPRRSEGAHAHAPGRAGFSHGRAGPVRLPCGSDLLSGRPAPAASSPSAGTCTTTGGDRRAVSLPPPPPPDRDGEEERGDQRGPVRAWRTLASQVIRL
jgi:hypothetical protein